MKKILFSLPVILLVAAGCNSTTPTPQPTTQQTQPTQQTQTIPTQQQQVAQNPTPTPIPTDTAQNPSTQNLKTYTNTQFGFGFSYPSTYTLKTSDKTNVSGQLFIVNISGSAGGTNSAPASNISISVWSNSKQLSPLEWALGW